MNKVYIFIITSVLGLVISFDASSSTHTFDFGSKLSGDGPASLNFASLTFDDAKHEFSLNFSDATNSFGNSAYIDLVAVDYTLIRNIRVKNVSGGVDNISFSKGNVPSSAYDFTFKVGNGENKLTNNENVDWFSSNFDFTKLASTSSPFALHVQGISLPKLNNRGYAREYEFDESDNRGLSGRYTIFSPIPEPETYAMLLVGLGVMGAVARRKQKV
jgi:hypothetical protein